MADRVVSWKAVANFTSLIAESAKGKKALSELREEENKLATAFEADSARIAAASKTQNAAIGDTSKSITDATKASKKNADDVVKDSKKKQSAYDDEAAALANIERAKRELDVSDKKRADAGQRLHAIQQALAAASRDVAKSQDSVNQITNEANKNTKDQIKAEKDLISARKSHQRITAADVVAENDRNKAIAEAAREENKAAQTAAALAAARNASARAARETEASIVRNTRANRDGVVAENAAAAAVDNDTAATTSNREVKKTFLQVLQNVQSLQKTYKGTVESVAAAQNNHARAMNKSLAASRELEKAESDLNAANSIKASSLSDIEHGETRLAETRNILSRATADVNNAEQAFSDARRSSGAGSREAVSAEQDLTAARRSYERISSNVASIESDISSARRAGAQAGRVIESSEARISNARSRAQATSNNLRRAQTRLNGEMNASQSIIKQVGNAWTSLGTLFSGTLDAFKDLVGMFGKLALTLLPQLIPLIGALSGGFMALAGSIGPISGLLGALPGLLLGAVTGFAAIKGAFSGVSQALKAYDTQQAASAKNSAKSSSAAKANAKAIVDAQRSLSQAKKSAASADKDAAQKTKKAVQSAAEANIEAEDNVKKAYADAAKAAKDSAQRVSDAKQSAAEDVKAANASVVDAEKNLQAAQEESAKAQDALNNVRKEAIQELEDMKKAARDAGFSERDATLDLIDARNKLAEVKEDPKASDSELMRAQLQYDEARARLSDAEEAKKQAISTNDEAQSKGIKGTQAYASAQDAAAAAASKVADAQAALAKTQQDQVKTVADAAKSVAQAEADAADSRKQSAQSIAEAQKQQAKTQKNGLESIAAARQAQARTEASGVESIRKAQETLANAMDKSNDATLNATKSSTAYNDALAKLTPSQRKFVEFLVGLKPKLKELKETAAANMLPGVEAGIRGVMPLFPAFKRSIGATSKAIGDAAANIGKTLGSGEGFGAMQRVLKTNDDAFKEVAGSSGHYTIALARVMDAARPLVTWIGHLVATFGEYLDKTTKTNKQNGSMAKFFESTKKAAKLFGNIIRNLSGYLYGVSRAGKGLGDELGGNLNKKLKEMNDRANSDAGQKKLKKWFKDIKPVIQAAGKVFGNIARSIAKLSGVGDKSKGGGLENLTYMLDQLANGVGPKSPLIVFLAKLNKSGGQKKAFDAIGGLFKAFTDFGNGPGGSVLGIMATELGLISKALGAIASNKAGAAALTALMTVAATAKVAKFASAATGVSGVGRMLKGGYQKFKARGSATPPEAGSGSSGGRVRRFFGRGGSGAATTASDETAATTAGHDVGHMYTQGIANGITENQRAAVNSIDAVTRALITRTRQNLDEHSPSRVAFKMGEFFSVGLANGIKSDVKQVMAASDSLEAAAVRGISSADEKMMVAGQRAGSAYARGLKSASKNASVSSSQLAAAGARTPAASRQRQTPVVAPAPRPEPTPRQSRGAAVRGGAMGVGGAAMMGSMFLPGKAGEVAGQAGMALMLVSMLPKLETLKKVFGSITKAIKLQTIATKISAAASKVFAGAQLALNLVMSANPIFLVIAGLVALGVAFYVLWTKSATFRKIVTGAFNAIKDAAVTVYNWFKDVGSKMFDGIKTAASNVFNWLKKNWKLILAIILAPFGGLQVYLIAKFWGPITSVFTKVINWIGGFFKKHWGLILSILGGPVGLAVTLIIKHKDAIVTGFKKLLSWIGTGFKKAWNGIKTILTAPIDLARAAIGKLFDSKSGIRKLLSSIWGYVSGAFKRAWAGIQLIFTSPITAAKNIISNLFGSKSGIRKLMSSIWSWVSDKFRSSWNGLKSIITKPIDLAKSAIRTALGAGKNGLQDIFSKAVSGIGKIWGGLKKVVTTPVNKVLDVIEGFAHLIGKIPGLGSLKKLKLPHLATGGSVPLGHGGGRALPARADGGTIPGPWKGPRADNVLGVSDAGMPVARVNPGEYITNVSATQKMQRNHPGALEYINRNGTLPRFANGGRVSGSGERPAPMSGQSWRWQWEQVKRHFPQAKLTSWTRPGARTAGTGSMSYHAIGRAIDIGGSPSTMKNVAKWLAKNYLPSTHDLIYTPLWGSKGFYKGGWYTQKPNTVAQHRDHVHWGLETAQQLLGRIKGTATASGGGGFKDWLADKAFSGPKKIFEAAMGKIPATGIPKMMIKGFTGKIVGAMKNFVTGNAEDDMSSLGGIATGGLGVSRWAATVKKALKMNGISPSASHVQKWLTQIGWESSGNASAVQGNIGDVNNRSGDLAKGLAQVIGSTFNAYKFPKHGNIFSGLDNLLAAINYAKHRYGKSKMFNFIGTGKRHGYAQGGFVGGHGNTDSVKAMLMPGEFVIRREAARQIGYGTLNQMNNVDRPGRATAFANGGSVTNNSIQHFATGGKVAPPSGKAISNSLKPGSRKFAWKMIRQLLGLKTLRGMDIPFPDRWDSSVEKAFVKHDYTIPGLSTIQKEVPVGKFLKPLTKWMQYTQHLLPGKTQMQNYASVSPKNYKQHPTLTRLIQKVIGIKQDGVWGKNMSKAVKSWKSLHGAGGGNNVSKGYTWKWLAQDYSPDSYGGKKGPHTSSKDKRVRLEDIANRYGLSMFQAAPLLQGDNKKYVDKRVTGSARKWAEYDASQMSGANSWIRGNFVKSYQSLFGVPQDGVWTAGMSDWMTYAMRKEMGKATKTIFPPWWSLDPIQKGIEDQGKTNKDTAEFLKDLDILSGWGYGYLVDKLQNDGVEEGLPVARVAVKSKSLAAQYDAQLKEAKDREATGTEDFTKYVAAVMAPGVQQGIRSLAQTLGMPDFSVVDMYEKLLKSGRLKKGERTSRLDREVSQFNSGLFYAATGGQVPGTGMGDTVPAMLTPGEFVLRKSAVKAIGLSNLYNLNNVQQFATGGQVYSFNELANSSNGFSNSMIDLRGLRNLNRERHEAAGTRRSTTADASRTVNNYTTINNPKAERSTASINRQLRKNAALGFMAVDRDSTKVNN